MSVRSESDFQELIKLQLLDIISNSPVIYKYINFDTGLLTLENSTIAFSHPLSFNDPYDCFIKLVDFKKVPKNYRQSLIDQYFAHLDTTEKAKMLAKMSKTPDEVAIKLLETKGMDNELVDRGVSCFSRKNDNLLMWSHYADSHKGICIGFNLLELYLSMDRHSNEKMVVLADYTDTFSPLSYYEHKIESIVRWLKTKSNIWSYEEEIRIIMKGLKFNETSKFIAGVDQRAFNSVYLGTRVSTENEKLILELCKKRYPEVTVSKIKPMESQFKLESFRLV